MAKYTDEYDLNASGYLEEIEKMDQQNRKFNRGLSQIKATLNENIKEFGNLSVVFKDINEQGQEQVGVIYRTDEGFKVLRKTTVDLESNLKKLYRTQRDAMRNYQAEIQVTKELVRVRKQLLAEDEKLEKARRAQVLKEQADLYRKLKEEAIRLAKEEKERRIALEGQLKVTKALQAAREKSLAQSREENRLANQRKAAEGLGQQLGSRFVDPFQNVGTPQQRARIANYIGEVTSLVQKGQISLSRANAILERSFAGTPQILSGVERKVQDLGIRINDAANTIGNGGGRINRTMRDVGDEGERAARRITLSWGDMLRILNIQLLHTAINIFLNQLRQSVDEAKNFAIRIGEIQTISLGQAQTFDDWATSVRKLSDEFGNPILDVAEGTYEAISNQVVKGGQSAAFMADALNLARLTVASTEDSVNSLSSVINAYGKSTNDAAQISGVLFKTVDLGRIRLADMSNTLGRITPLAASLGISFEELAAAISTLTIQGISPSETLTAINGVLTKLNRPTTAMKNLLAEWGVASGQAAIATFGFYGTIQKLIEASNTGEAELAELFNEIRATRGIQGLTRAFDNYGNVLQKTMEGQADFVKASDIMAKNLGVQFNTELTRIKNLFIQDFGIDIIEKILSWGTAFDDAGNRVSGLAEKIRDLISVVKIAGAGFLSYLITTRLVAFGAGLVTGALEAQARTASLIGPQIAGLSTGLIRLRNVLLSGFATAGITAGLGALFFYFESVNRQLAEIEEDYRSLDTRSQERAVESTKQLAAELEKQKTLFQKNLDRRFADYSKFINNINLASKKLGEEQNKIIEESAKALRDSFDVYSKQAQASITALERQSSTALSNIEKATKRIQEIREGLETGRFQAKLDLLPPVEQIKAIEAEIVRLQTFATQRLLQPATTSQQAEKNFELAEKARERVAKLENDLAEKRRDASEKVLDLEQRIAENKRRQEEDQAVGGAEDRLRQTVKDQQLVNALKQGEVRTGAAAARQARQERAEQRAQQIRDKQSGQDQVRTQRQIADARRDAAKDTELNKELALQKALLAELGDEQKIRDQMADTQRQMVQAYQQFIQQNQTLEQQAATQAKAEAQRLEALKTSFAEIAKFKLPDDIKPDNFAEISKQIQDVFDKGIKGTTDQSIIKQLIDQRTRLEEEAARRVDDFRRNLQIETNAKIRDDLVQQQKAIGDAILSNAQSRAKEINDLRGGIDILRKLAKSEQGLFGFGGNLGERTEQRIADSIAALETAKTPKEVEAIRKILDKDIKTIVNFIASNEAGTAPQDVLVKDSPIPSERVTLLDFYEDLQLITARLQRDAGTPVELDAQRAKLAAELAKLPDVGAQAGNVATNMQTLAAATADLAKKFQEFGFQPQQKAFGGFIRGTDRIPAMLTAGEFVVNAASTKKYWKHLMMINSGIDPVYRAQGGIIPNVTSAMQMPSISNSGDTYNFGDINPVIQSSGNAQVDAKQLVREVNRLIRRGEISLRR